MPRTPRQEHEGAIYHVFARCVNRVRVFVDDDDYERYTSIFAATIDRHDWNCLGYCLMPNHVHLLLETPRPNLGQGMQWLHGLYAQTFNERHARIGHLFQGRYRAELVKDDAYLATLVGYVAMNPVAAVLCRRPEDWQWSSHAWIAAGSVPPWLAHERLRELLGGSNAAYDAAIESRWEMTVNPNPQVRV